MKRKILLLGALCLVGSSVYAAPLTNTNQKPKEKMPVSKTEVQTNNKLERKTTSSDSFERKKIYETKYFKIFYDENSLKQAQELIRVADEIAEVEAKLFKMELPKKIKVYVMDTQDNSNAYSTGFGIHLFVTNNGGITNEYKDYIPYLFSHELTHELLDYKVTGNGFNKYIPLSDRLVIDASIPRWWTEGMAVMVESMISQGGGRTFDPAFLAIAKRDLNENKFKGLGPTYVNKPYEYGNSFMRFYLETYGIDKVSESIDYYSKHKVGGLGRAFAHVAGDINADELHDQWMDYLIKITNDVKGKLVEGPAVFDNHSYNAGLIKTGDAVWTYKVEMREAASTKAGHNRHALALLKIPFDSEGNPDYDNVKEYQAPTAIISNQPAIKVNYIYYASCPLKSNFRGSEDNISYRYNLKTGESTILKLNRPDKFVNVNGKIYYTFLQDGSVGISTLEDQVILNPGKYSISSMSDAGKNRMLFTAKVDGEKGSKVFLLDLETRKITFLTNGKTASLVNEKIEETEKTEVTTKSDEVKKIETSEGKDTLYFTDNFGEEVNNVYKMELGTKKVTKLTNVLYNAKSPVVINDKIVYLNLTSKGSSVSYLDTKYAVNEESQLNILEDEREVRTTKNFKMYGKYGVSYNPDVKTDVTTQELHENTKKEIRGIPSFSKPYIAISNSGINVKIPTADLNTQLLLSYDLSSFYTGIGSVIQPGAADAKRGSAPLYYTFKKQDHKTDKYMIGVVHQLSSFSDATFGYFHSEYITNGVSYSNVGGKDSKGERYRSTSDEMFLMLPFNIPSLQKSAYFGIYTAGDFASTSVSGADLIWNNKITLEFGYDRYSSFLSGEAKTKFGLVIKNKKNKTGARAVDYMYVDRDIKRDIPYIRSLSYLKLRTRLYFAPKPFTDNDSALTDLGASGTGFDSVGGSTDSVRTMITNAKFAANIYGDMNYNVPIEKGSDFGMVYLKDMNFRLGYSYTGFVDEDYKGRTLRLDDWKTRFPGAYAQSRLTSAERNKNINDGANDYLNNKDVENAAEAITQAMGINPLAKNFKGIVQATKLVAIDSKTISPQIDKLIKTAYSQSPKAQAAIDKFAKLRSNVNNGNYIATHTPEKVSKFRHGMVLNPSVAFNGNLYSDSASFTVEVGNTWMAEFTDDKMTDTSLWYASVELRF